MIDDSQASAKPTGYEDLLGDFGPQLFDGYCSEPIGWGFKVTSWVGEERWAELHKLGSVECLNWEPPARGEYALITKWLTPDEALQKYGEIREFDIGPNGGFRSVTYGDKEFIWHGVKPIFLENIRWDWSSWQRVEEPGCPQGKYWAERRQKCFKDNDGKDLGKSITYIKLRCKKGDFKLSSIDIIPLDICDRCQVVSSLNIYRPPTSALPT